MRQEKVDFGITNEPQTVTEKRIGLVMSLLSSDAAAAKRCFLMELVNFYLRYLLMIHYLL